MMPLKSNIFKNSRELNACEVSDAAHVTPGAQGKHVRLIQVAVMDLDGSTIDPGELAAMRYGSSTAAAVLAYKQSRGIINRAYQGTADNIVGKMTIAALDREMFEKQEVVAPNLLRRCYRAGPVRNVPVPRRPG